MLHALSHHPNSSSCTYKFTLAPISLVNISSIFSFARSLLHTHNSTYYIMDMHTEIRDFMVTVSKKEVVAAKFPNQEHWLPLSNLDMCFGPPLDFSLFFCYTKPTYEDNWTFVSKVEVLKKALAEALVPYYALAGEIIPNSMGEPEILCNNRGVDFIEGFADIELQNLNLYRADETIGCKLVPKKKNGVLAVQVRGGTILCSVGFNEPPDFNFYIYKYIYI